MHNSNSPISSFLAPYRANSTGESRRNRRMEVEPLPQSDISVDELIENLKDNETQKSVSPDEVHIPSSSQKIDSSSLTSEGRKLKKMEQPDVSWDGITDNGTLTDEKRLLNIFPQEIWNIILEEVKEPADLENLSNASTFFRNELLPKRTLFLFSKVWKILDTKYHQNEPPEVQFPVNGHHHEAEGEHYKKCKSCDKWNVSWWIPSTLSMRLVCQTWSTAIDNSFQDLPSKYKLTSDPEELRICTTRGTEVSIDDKNLETLCSFWKHFNATHYVSKRNPFISRTVHISLTEIDLDKSYYKLNRVLVDPFKIIQARFWGMLELYGRHIWYLKINTFDEYEWTSVYYKLHRVVRRIRNRKVYVVSVKGNIISSEYPALKVDKTPFSPETFLKSSAIGGPQVLVTCGISQWVSKDMLRFNNQISVLEIYKGNDKEDHAIQKYHLPHLKQLSIRIDSELEFLNLVSADNAWELIKLGLDFEKCEFINWSSIFRGLEKKWAGTELTSLKLKLPKATREADQENIIRNFYGRRLELPQIINLQVVMKNLSSLDFILPMKDSLEFLEITIAYDVDKKTKNLLTLQLERKIKFLSCSDRFQETNMWTLFPKLKRIQLTEVRFRPNLGEYDAEETTVFTRKEWKNKVVKN